MNARCQRYVEIYLAKFWCHNKIRMLNIVNANSVLDIDLELQVLTNIFK